MTPPPADDTPTGGHAAARSATTSASASAIMGNRTTAPADTSASTSTSTASTSTADTPTGARIDAAPPTRPGFTLPTIWTTGTLGTLAIALASWSAGATRTRDGLLRSWGLGWLTYGHGNALGSAVLITGSVALLLAWTALGRRILDGTVSTRRLLALGATWAAPFALAAPLFSRDIYSYLIQGELLRRGHDPYVFTAIDVRGPLMWEVSPDWRNTTTPYGPLHLWIADGVVSLSHDNVDLGITLFRVLTFAGFAVLTCGVAVLARRLAANPTFALWIGPFNPLVLFHLLGGLHNEALMVAASVWAIFIAVGKTPGRRVFIDGCVSAFLIGIAVALKATGVLVLPFVVWIIWRRAGHPVVPLRQTAVWLRVPPRLIGLAVVLTAVAVLPLAVITALSGNTWGWVSQMTGNTKVINLLAFPTLAAELLTEPLQLVIPGVSFNSVLETSRPVSMIVMAVLLVSAWLFFRRTPHDAVLGIAIAYLVASLFNAVTLPWYYVPGVALVGVVLELQHPEYHPRRAWIIPFTVSFSLIISLSFQGSGNNWLYNWGWMAGVGILAYSLYTQVFRGWGWTQASDHVYQTMQRLHAARTQRRKRKRERHE